jgi:hypothetical protein
MSTKIRIKRGTTSSIIEHADTLLDYEIVYATDTGQLGVKTKSTDVINTPVAWQLAKDTFSPAFGKNAFADYYAVAIGAESNAGQHAVAIGDSSDATQGSTVVGYDSTSTSQGGIVLGARSIVSSNPHSISIGNDVSNTEAINQTKNNSSIIIGSDTHSGTDGKNILIGAEISTGDSENIVIGNTSSADYDSVIIGHDNTSNASNSISIGNGIENESANHVQLGNSDVLTGNIGNRPIDLQGAIQTVNLTIPSNNNGSSVNLNTLFSSKSIGTVGMFFFNGFLDGNQERGLRLMNNSTTPITSFYNSESANSQTIFTFKIIKISATQLQVYAFVGEGFSSSTFTVIHNNASQIITLSPSAIIQYAKGSPYDDETATLNIKFI